MIDYTDAIEAGWHIFPLHPIVGGACGCGDPECKAIGKHPRAGNWQATQKYDADQLAYLEDEDGVFFGNQLQDHYGIVVNSSGLLVVDIDGRNGGFEAAKKLENIKKSCGLIVTSGSGFGQHWYFKMPEGVSLKTNLPEYPGIDFKSSGFVVGCGSLHASGYRYEREEGSPQAITDAPAELIELLKRPERKSFVIEGKGFEAEQLKQMLEYVKHDEDQTYDRWLSVGMALHHATSGGEIGRELWHQWSEIQGRTDNDKIDSKYHGFGKGGDPITEGTLYSWARQGGYIEPVTFVDDTQWGDLPEIEVKKETANGIDLKNPPGLVGTITKWINSRCMYPRESLAVAAALQLVSNIAGLNYLVDEYRTSLNLITLGIAGSRTGKGAIKACMEEVHHAMGLSPATHGKFKSSQELVRNAINHQAIHYIYDEFGKQLEKLGGAGRSGAHYLEDLMAELIAIYSEATSYHGISGDMKREIVEDLERRMMRLAKNEGMRDGESVGNFALKSPKVRAIFDQLQAAKQGIKDPYLTFFALSEPYSYSAALEKDPWLATGGFLGRALFFEELDNVPAPKPICEVSREPLDGATMLQLGALAGAGSTQESGRIERQGEWQLIRWSSEARAFAVQCTEYWRSVAISESEQGTGLESQALGATELTIKIAGVLSVAEGIISLENIQWAHELIKLITHDKINRAKSSEKLQSRGEERGEGLLESLMRHLRSVGETTPGKARQAVGRTKVTLEDTIRGLEYLKGEGKITLEQSTGKNGRVLSRYKIN